MHNKNKIPVPDAIFIGHSHYDHLLDAIPFLKLHKQSGCEVPVYGSSTTKNIINGYERFCDCKYTDKENDSVKWSYNSKIVKTLDEWKPVESISCTKPSESDDKILYKAYIADHAAHFKYGILEINYFRGKQRTPSKSPPTSSYHFKEGDTYFFIFQLMNNDKSYKIGIAGAATDIDDYELKYMDNCTERNDDLCLDVLILTVPGWKFKDEYPKGLIQKLRPHHIVLSHFDEFFDKKRDVSTPVKTVITANLDEFILKLQDDIDSMSGYNRFESIIIQEVDTTIYISKN